MQGYVKQVNFGWAFLTGADGRDVFCHATAMECDDIGRRYLLPDERVTFDIGEHNGRVCAKDVRLVNPRPVVDLNGYYEEGAVKVVGRKRQPEIEQDLDTLQRRRAPVPVGEWCFVLRPFGGCAYLHWENVKSFTTQNAKGNVRFYVGQLWRFEIKPPYGGQSDEKAWQAVNAVELGEAK